MIANECGYCYFFNVGIWHKFMYCCNFRRGNVALKVWMWRNLWRCTLQIYQSGTIKNAFKSYRRSFVFIWTSYSKLKLIFGSGDWSLRILLELQTPKPLVSIYKHGIVRYPLRRRKYILQWSHSKAYVLGSFFFLNVVYFIFLLQELWACSNPNCHIVNTITKLSFLKPSIFIKTSSICITI